MMRGEGEYSEMDPAAIDNSSSCSCNKFTKLISIISFVLGIIGIGLAAWMFVSIDDNFGDIDVDFTSLTKDIEELALAIGDSPKVTAGSNHSLQTLSVTEPTGLYKHIDESSVKIEGVINNIAETIGGSDEIKGAINGIAELIGNPGDDDTSLFELIDNHSDEIKGTINGIANTIGSSDDENPTGLFELIDNLSGEIDKINSNIKFETNAVEFIAMIEGGNYDEKMRLSSLGVPMDTEILDVYGNSITTKYNLFCADTLCAIMEDATTVKVIKEGFTVEVTMSLTWDESQLKAKVGEYEAKATISSTGSKIRITITGSKPYTVISNDIGLQNGVYLTIYDGNNAEIYGMGLYSESNKVISLREGTVLSGSPIQYYTYVLSVSEIQKQAYHKVVEYLKA